jgi:hypothetical protein
MRPEEFVFVFIMTVVSGAFFLVLLKMILNFFKDLRQGKDASLGAGELEAMIQRAVEAGTESLHDRLDHLEQQLASPRTLPPHATTLLDEVMDPDDPANIHESRRAVRSR